MASSQLNVNISGRDTNSLIACGSVFSRRTEVKWARSPPMNSVCRVDRDLIHHVFQELWRLAPQKREKELGDLRFNVDCDLLFI